MAVRHAIRHIRASMEDVVAGMLEEYGWTGEHPPYGAKRVTVLRQPPKQSELVPVAANTVFISHGDESPMSETQLGGGMLYTEHILFVDVVAENETIALAIATDVKDRLNGLIGGSKYLRPVDHGTGQELPGYLGEFDDVVREQPNPGLASWQSVKATLGVDFPGERT